MDKKHSKDYLIEYADSEKCPKWLKYIICEAIKTNGKISNDFISNLANILSQGEDITLNENLPENTQETSDNKILLSSLTHVSGINALAEKQTIDFSENITVLHGMNGAGKSSYFRILNEIIGGNQEKKILPNIYAENNQDIQVKLEYKIGANKKSLVWNSNIRALSDFSLCSVFDNSYLHGFLNSRQSDKTLISPLGLNLFSSISCCIDALKTALNKLADQKRLSKPNIDFESFREETKQIFLNHSPMIEKTKNSIMQRLNFSREQETRLKEASEKIKQLENSHDDELQLLKIRKSSYAQIKTSIEKFAKDLNDLIKETYPILLSYEKNKQSVENLRKTLKIFNTVPSSNSPEWKEFIKAGDKYSKTIHNMDKCPYCQQDLSSEKAKALVQAYSAFLQDQSEESFEKNKEQLASKKDSLGKLNNEISIENSIESSMTKVPNASGIQLKSIGQNQSKTLVLFQDTIEALNSCIKSYSQKNFPQRVNPQETIKWLEDEIDKITARIEEIELLAKQAKEESLINSLKKEVQDLSENQSMAQQKNKISNWLKINTEEQKIKEIMNGISTASITKISNTAHNELLTETLKNNFNSELKNMGKGNLKVELSNLGASKGKSINSLKLIGNNNIEDIMSEGEQKAIGLALFFAEIQTKGDNGIIILDDPVNSLDHQIASNVAERLIQFNNQVIIFNHNALFLSAFENSQNAHVCKTCTPTCSASKNKHIFIYDVEDEGESKKGVISVYKQNKTETHIRELKNMLSQSPFKDRTTAAIKIRKCVECCIDEYIFNKQIPTKFKAKKSSIDWSALKNLCNDSRVIDSLKEIHSRVSGGELHNGVESANNSLTVADIQLIVNTLETIIQNGTSTQF